MKKKNVGFILWLGLILVVLINIFFSLAFAPKVNSIPLLLSFVFGRVLAFPIIILLLSQIWAKHRNGRSRVKALFYGSLAMSLSLLPEFGEFAKNIQ